MSIVYCSAPNKQYFSNIHDAISLDNSSNIIVPALSYITIDGVRVQWFSRTLLGEARWWYQSLVPINVDWQGLQNLFRQQYSKIGNTREQLFHALSSFNFDENTETIDTYVTHIRQVAALIGYGEPQILEVFKNTLSTKLYWILFPIEDLRQAVETAKRILTKEKLDRQLTRQMSATAVMSIRDCHNRKVSFDTRDELGDNVTLWWCYTTAPGTLGDSRHLLGLVSLGTRIEGFEQNREELSVYHLLSYHLLKYSRCQAPDIKHHSSQYFINTSTSVQVKQ